MKGNYLHSEVHVTPLSRTFPICALRKDSPSQTALPLKQLFFRLRPCKRTSPSERSQAPPQPPSDSSGVGSYPLRPGAPSGAKFRRLWPSTALLGVPTLSSLPLREFFAASPRCAGVSKHSFSPAALWSPLWPSYQNFVQDERQGPGHFSFLSSLRPDNHQNYATRCISPLCPFKVLLSS